MSWQNRSFGFQVANRSTTRKFSPTLESLESRQLLTGDVVINEIVASNDTSLATIAGKTPDWIELHNRSEKSVDLAGWQLRDPSAIWTFPEMALAPDAFLIVFASGDDFIVTEPQLEIHTNFKLKAGGEYLGLLRPDGSVAHEFNPFPEQITDQSYGLSRNESFTQYFAAPTPGAENPVAPRIVISELMSSNQSTLADEDGDFADWLEIYNASDSPANMTGWILESDNIDWEFPEVVLGPHEYRVIFASGNDRREPDAPLHTNFKLGSNYDEVDLYRPDWTWAHGFYYPSQREDVSYGLTSDLAETQYFESPTPGAPNLTGFQGARFSPASGVFWENAINVYLSTEAEDAVIRFTIDGSDPTEDSPVYTEAITLNQSSVVKATTFIDGLEPTTSSRTYILQQSVRNQSNDGKPQTWGFVADYEVDPAVEFRDWVLYSSPSLSITVDDDDLFSIEDGIFAHPVMEGDAWRRPVTVEYISPNGDLSGVSMAATGLINTTGRPSERNPAITSKFSLEIEFDSPLRPAEFGRSLFQNDLDDASSEQYFGLVLRAGHADSWLSADSAQRHDATYVRSRFVRETHRAMGQPAFESNSVNLFINNMYWGQYDLTDRPSAEMVAEKLGGKAANYDVIDENGPVAGNTEAWDSLIGAAKEDLSNPDAYRAVTSQIDLESLIDFIILKRFAQIENTTVESWFAAKHRERNEGFKFFFNDNAESLGLPSSATQSQLANAYYAPEYLFEQLIRNDEFNRIFADRVQHHTYEGGALSQGASLDRWYNVQSRNYLVYLESARWGDFRRDGNPSGPAELYDGQKLFDFAYSFGERYFASRPASFVQELVASGEFPSVTSPQFLTNPGEVAKGHRLRLNSDAGVVYYTLDGSDPASPDGSIAPTAQLFKSAIRLTENTQVRARSLDGNAWSAISDGTFLMQEPLPLKITEIMYHPALNDPDSLFDDDDFEFIELQNVGEETIDLSGIEFDRGIGFKFDDGSVRELAPGDFVLIVKNHEAFASRYQTNNVSIAGVYEGQLGNGGEQIRLVDSFGQTIQRVLFEDAWYPLSDGAGFSLVRKDATAGSPINTDPREWTISSAIEGTPGIGESQLPPSSIVINEVMTSTTSPLGDWIELANQSDQTIDIGGWFLSDDLEQLKKYQIPFGTHVPADGFITFDHASDFGNTLNPNAVEPFNIDVEETLFLSSGDDRGRLGGYRELARLPVARPEVAVGRIEKIDGTADYAALLEPTRGTINASPIVGPIVINEIMYVPIDGGVEYVELVNLSDHDVALFDPLHPADSWRISEGIKFTFPDNTIVPAGGTVLIVKADPTIYKERAALADDVQVFGPFKGALRNQGESVGLYQAWSESANAETQYLVVDRVEFDDASPWPVLARSGISSLQRIAQAEYGNDAINWAASIRGGTPGTANINVDSSPRSIPMVEPFDVESLDQLKGWTFSAGQDAYLSNYSSLLSSYVDDDCRTCSFDDNQTTATLAVNIERADELALVMELDSSYGDMIIQVSDNQRDWYTVLDRHYQESRQVFAIDLATVLIDNGIDEPGARYIRFVQQGADSGMNYNSIAVISQDVVGPWIEDYSFKSIGDSITAIEVTFDEAIALDSFTVDSLEIRNPTGAIITPTSIVSDDGKSFTINFSPQSADGAFNFFIEPSVMDLAGNALNRFNYSINKASPAHEGFDASFVTDTGSLQAYPYTEGFESGLPRWDFATSVGATWQVIRDPDAVQGMQLLLDQQTTSSSSMVSSTADIPIVLGDASERTDLSFDFWAKGKGNGSQYVTLLASNEGGEWQPIYGLNLENNYRHYSFDLDRTFDDLGINTSDPVVLRFEHASRSPGKIYFDDIRVNAIDVFGPYVEASSFASEEQPFDAATVTFSEPIDFASFDSNAVSIVNPVGKKLTLNSIDPIDDRTVRMSFEQQRLAGKYRVVVSPIVRDVHGNLMNQDDSPAGGENGADQYETSFSVPLEPTIEYPYAQSFENDAIENLEGWAFASNGPSEWAISDGMLRGRQVEVGSARHEAILNLDLSEHVDDDRISLRFSTSGRGGASGSLFVGSSNGRWSWVTDMQFGSGSLSNTVLHSVDLKQSLAGRGLQVDDDVRILFQFNTHSRNSMVVMDSVRVDGEEVFGPRVIENTVLEPTENGQSKVTVTFDKPIDPSTFTVADVSLQLTGGIVRAHRVDAVSPETFDVYFQTPGMAGIYNLSIGPNIRGVNGIPMNQTLDPFSGLANDAFTGTVFVPFEPVQVPYTQTFPVGDITSLGGWMFHTINESGTRAGGEWRVTSNYNPYGQFHLQQTQFADCWSQHDGILALDVSRLAGSTDLILEFDMSRTTTNENKSQGGERNMGQLLVGSENTSFTQVGGPEFLLTDDGIERFGDLNRDGILDLVPQFSEYVHYKFDLDELLAAGGVAVDGTVFVNFHRLAFYSSDITVWDNIRVYDASETNDQPFVESVEIVDESENPDLTIVRGVAITFDRAVQGFEIADLTLTRNGQPIDFGPSAQLISVNAKAWILSGLHDTVDLPGAYRLTLDAEASGIVDGRGSSLLSDFSTEWNDTRVLGDSNLDGIFNSADFVIVFQAGEYEDSIVGNSTWSDGDWNGDGDFTSRDLVEAFQTGHYVAAATAVVTNADLAAAIDAVLADEASTNFTLQDNVGLKLDLANNRRYSLVRRNS